jgi:hypothetical protein
MFTFDFNTEPLLSQVRALIPDTDPPGIFSDDEINMFINLESSQGLYVSGQAAPTASSRTVLPIIYSVRRSAAMGLDIIANKLTRLAGVVQILDVKLQLNVAAAQAKADAKDLRDQEARMGHFAIAEMVNDQFSARERVYNQMLRIEAGS